MYGTRLHYNVFRLKALEEDAMRAQAVLAVHPTATSTSTNGK